MTSDHVRIGRTPAAPTTDRDLVVGLSPFGRPDAALVAAVCHAGALGILDLGGPADQARAELARLASWTDGPFGVRMSRCCELTLGDLDHLADRIDVLLVDADRAETLLAAPDQAAPDHGAPDLADDAATAQPVGAHDWRILVEVTSLEEATAASRTGAAGLVAVGNEAAGRVGQASSFVLLQQVLAADLGLPIWVRGGIGPDTAAGAVVGAATGVVLDVQLSLLAEADSAASIASTRCRLDAATTVVAGYRVQVPLAARTAADQAATTVRDVLDRVSGRDGQPAWTMLGQDSLLAEGFARRFGTVARAVRAVRSAIAAATGTDSVPGDPGTLRAPDATGTSGTTGTPNVAEAARRILAEDSAMCVAFGLRRPVVQGPMTRVSDLPAFAAAIADDGAMPCVALAMADRTAATRMLHGTRDLLGGRPWGAGILGFGDERVRAAQLEVVRETRPSLVVIAGGQPAQAAGLEAEGIPAFLHVPSPVLLGQYLQAGSRRFVFEGTECGGHVGPLASFPLWQAQLDVLAEFLDGPGRAAAAEVQVLFAGGIHDECSAAMVAAAAGPLAARGAAVGMLMGTAYLFTEEAVGTGAIQPVFQQQVMAAGATAVLQSAPGHLTRCVPSPFVEHFDRERQRLAERGERGPVAWAALESLNVGRLRVAAKGIQRRGDDLVTVDAAEQLAEGLFMAGQVATLRSEVTTIAALHDSVTAGAVRLLDLARQRVETAANETAANESAADESAANETANAVDVAIVGMACVLPKAADLAEYWSNIVNGVDAIEQIPQHRWDPEVYYDSTLGTRPSGRHTPSKWGGFLPRIPFDPLRYGIPPSCLSSIEPVQFLALEVARRALEDADLAETTFDRSRTAVVFGTETNSEYQTAITLRSELLAYYRQVPRELDEVLPKITADTFPGILGNIIASRISNRLDLAGPAYVVDAACGSSLAALDLACKELLCGTADTVLCGGADLHVASTDYLLFSSLGALSPSGRAKPFDAAADGTTLAEGIACVVLKRLADAERDGDRIYAVVKGVAGASDGRSLSITAPRVEGQYLALRRTYQRAGVSPAEVQLVEAHGTGTTVGDQTELKSLTRMYSQAGAEVGATQLGSVKSQIGHAKTAAGLAGLIKVALSVYHGVRPPTLHVKDPNPEWDPRTSPFAFSTAARPWPVSRSQRRAAVSAFGFGGANFHTVVSGHGHDVPSRHTLDTWPVELFVFRGADMAAARAVVADLRRLITTNDAAGRPWRLRDLARSAAVWAQQSSAPVQIALVATDLDDLDQLLDLAVQGGQQPRRRLYTAEAGAGAPGVPRGKLAVLFPGQGSQRPGMLAELFVAFPQLQQYLRLGGALADLIHPPTSFTPEQAALAKATLADTRAAQPALGIAGLAANHLLQRLGIAPDMVAGHSYGELVALAAAGAYDAGTLLRLSSRRATAILDAAEASGGDTGSMAAVRAPADEVRRVLAESGLADEVVLANNNAPLQVVVSGTTPGIAKAVVALREAGHTCTAIPVACAFHSHLVASAVERFATALAEAPIAAPVLPVFANRLAAEYPATAHGVRTELAAQVGAPVRFVEQVEAMYAAGARVFVEAGPGRVLTGLVKAILGTREHTAVAIDDAGDGLPSLLDAMARLAVAGVVPDTRWLYRGRDAVDVTGAKPKPRPAWSIDGRAVVTADGQPLPGGLRPTRLVDQPAPGVAPLAGAPLSGAPAAGNGHRSAVPGPLAGTVPVGGVTPAAVDNTRVDVDDRRLVVTEFLRTSRDMLAQQRDVLLSYLGTPGGGTRASSGPGAGVGPAAIGAAIPAPLAAPLPLPELAQPPAPAPTAVASLAAAPLAAPTQAAPAIDITATVIATICETTGYPADMIEPDLDLEADLSIDSIKRTEIAGILIQRIPQAATAGIDELTRHRSIRAITNCLTAKTTAQQPTTQQPTTQQPTTQQPTVLQPPAQQSPAQQVTARPTTVAPTMTVSVAGASAPAPAAAAPGTGRPPRRFVVEYRPQPLPAEARTPTPTALTGRRVTICGSAPAAVIEAIGDRVGALGAGSTETSEAGDPGGLDIVVLLGGFGQDDELDLPMEYYRIRSVLTGRPKVLIGAVPLAAATADTVSGGDGDMAGRADRRHAVERAAGLRGLVRTIALEYPAMVTRFVEVDREAADLAEAVVAELVAAATAMATATGPGSIGGNAGSTEPAGSAVIARHGAAGRTVARPVDAPIGLLALSGAGPAGEGSAEASAIGLDRDSVVVLVGGARGITAGFTTLLASAAGCRVELFGRSARPDEAEDPSTAGALDEAGLRQAMIAAGVRSPRRLRAEVGRILAEREIRATLDDVRRLGGRANYRQVDVLNGDALRNALKQIVADSGRVDGVVYAAGVLDDRLIADKDLESFRRVFATKVDGARALLSTLDDLAVRPGFVTMYGSIAAVAGNRGQSDYAAANDALETIGCAWARRTGVRTLTVHWGPWAPSPQHPGMVNPGLQAEFTRRRIELIDQEQGHLALLRELAWGDRATTAVVYTASGWFLDGSTEPEAGR